MILRLLLLHGRWFALFVLAGALGFFLLELATTGFAGLQAGRIWSRLEPLLGLFGALAVLAPWARFLTDPRRAQPISVDGFAAYWKLR